MTNPEQSAGAMRNGEIAIRHLNLGMRLASQLAHGCVHVDQPMLPEEFRRTESEADGRHAAIQKLVQSVIEGVQSNW